MKYLSTKILLDILLNSIMAYIPTMIRVYASIKLYFITSIIKKNNAIDV